MYNLAATQVNHFGAPQHQLKNKQKKHDNRINRMFLGKGAQLFQSRDEKQQSPFFRHPQFRRVFPFSINLESDSFFVAKSRIPNPSPQLPLGKLYKHNSKQCRHNLPSVSQFQSFKTHQSVIFFVLQKHRYGNLLFQNFEMFGRVAINSFFVLAPEQTSRQFIYSTLPLSLPLPPPDRLFCNSRASNSAN